MSQRCSLHSALCLVYLFLSLAMAHAAAAPSRRRPFSLARTRVAALLRLYACIAALCARIATVVKLSARACSGTHSLSRARNIPGCIWGLGLRRRLLALAVRPSRAGSCPRILRLCLAHDGQRCEHCCACLSPPWNIQQDSVETDAQPFSNCNHQFGRGFPPQEYEQHGAWPSSRGAGTPTRSRSGRWTGRGDRRRPAKLVTQSDMYQIVV